MERSIVIELNILKERLADATTLEELKAQFDLSELATLAKENLLQEWLKENFYDDLAEALTVEVDDDELCLLLCEQLEIDVSLLADFDAEAIGRALMKRQKRTLYIGEGEDEAGGAIVYSQKELAKAFGVEGGYTLIYLVDGVFRIPVPKNEEDRGANVTYIGRGNAVVEISCAHDVDFDAVNVVLKNLQVVLKHNIQVKCENSSDIKFLTTDKVALSDDLTKQEIYLFLHGKNALENDTAYAERAGRMKGIAIGEVLLDSNDYDAEHQIFRLKPIWRMDFLTVVRKFAMDKFFTCFVPSHLAQEIYNKERHQIVYSDFFAKRGEAAIACVYLMTSTGSRIDILLADTPDEIPTGIIDSEFGSEGFASVASTEHDSEMSTMDASPEKKNDKNVLSAGSGANGMGYGLYLISCKRKNILPKEKTIEVS